MAGVGWMALGSLPAQFWGCVPSCSVPGSVCASIREPHTAAVSPAWFLFCVLALSGKSCFSAETEGFARLSSPCLVPRGSVFPGLSLGGVLLTSQLSPQSALPRALAAGRGTVLTVILKPLLPPFSKDTSTFQKKEKSFENYINFFLL